MPVASAMIAVHRDHLVLDCNAPWPEIQSFVCRGQLFLLTFRNGRTDNDNFVYMMEYIPTL